MIYIVREKNSDVTDYYFDIIRQASELICKEVVVIDSLSSLSGNKSSDIVIVGTSIKAIKLAIRGYKNIVVWFQGIIPEESYMRNHSILRKKVLEVIEKKALDKSKLSIFVSKAMKEHYEKKYDVDVKNKYYIMPCFNTGIIKESFFKPEKYENNIFSYTGSISPWQGFDKILKCYEEIEQFGIPNTKLLVLTPDKDKAIEEIKKTSINNYEISYSKVEELPSILEDVKFGFIIRDDIEINNVSTPTKLSTYLSNGLIPIYSDCIKDFHEKTSDFKYKLSYDSLNFFQETKSLMTNEIDAMSVYSEYLRLFDEYYNKNHHKDKISEKLKECFGIGVLKNE